MSIKDEPLPMTQLGVAMIQDLGNMYENHSSHEQGDLLTVLESMYEKGLHRKVSSECCFATDEIERARKSTEKGCKKAEKEKEDREKDSHRETGWEQENKESRVKEKGSLCDAESKDPDNCDRDFRRDFARVHLERACNSSSAHWRNDGRRYRRRTYSGSSIGDPHESQ
ncbi:predicted protein [Nematostella vectensis]|uniref:Uncharacterized protein n=1 Tax=Nematostella vectensis TaxID=45351 RepID=A7RHD0_NEMVE|nr:predicted protein [Nematostella vectensis]|eukprot:XP_001641271.1 predicted protein [Nematostella vectensis]